jgi:predicted nuclease of predicted toxin-antitoxin system
VKLLLDANLSPRLADLLNQQGIESVHVREHGLQHADDEPIFDFAAGGDHVLVSEDIDFGELLARRNANRPSVILLRSGEPLTPETQASILIKRGARPRRPRGPRSSATASSQPWQRGSVTQDVTRPWS